MTRKIRPACIATRREVSRYVTRVVSDELGIGPNTAYGMDSRGCPGQQGCVWRYDGFENVLLHLLQCLSTSLSEDLAC